MSKLRGFARGWVLVVPNFPMGLLLGVGFGPRFLRNVVITDLISDGATKYGNWEQNPPNFTIVPRVLLLVPVGTSDREPWKRGCLCAIWLTSRKQETVQRFFSLCDYWFRQSTSKGWLLEIREMKKCKQPKFVKALKLELCKRLGYFDWLNNLKAISPSIRRKNKTNRDLLSIGYTY